MTVDRLLRWYPAAWRARYGQEYEVLLEDVLDGARPTVRFQLSVAWAGLGERCRAVGLVGRSAPAGTRKRTGSLVVLWAWTLFVLAGCALAKRAEHAGAGHRLAIVQSLAFLSALAVLVGAVAGVPSALRFVRAGGWRAVAGHARRACLVSVVAGVSAVALILWAHTLPARDVESGVWPYGAAFVASALLVSAAALFWTGVAVATARRIEWSSTVLEVESWLAAVVCAAMTAMTLATVAWSTAAQAGASGIGLIVAVLVLTDAAALYGAARARTA